MSSSGVYTYTLCRYSSSHVKTEHHPFWKGKTLKANLQKLGFHVCLGVWSAIHQLSRLTASSTKKKQVASTHLPKFPNHFAMDKPLRIHGTGMCVIYISYLMVDFHGHFVGRYTRATSGLEGKCGHGFWLNAVMGCLEV